MNTRIIVGVSVTALIVGVAVALAQPSPQPPKAPGPNVSVTESQLNVIPGLVNSVNELKKQNAEQAKEIAALKNQLAYQLNKLTDLERQTAGNMGKMLQSINILTQKFDSHDHQYFYQKAVPNQTAIRTSRPCKNPTGGCVTQ